jgi:hypothetical protein
MFIDNLAADDGAPVEALTHYYLAVKQAFQAKSPEIQARALLVLSGNRQIERLTVRCEPYRKRPQSAGRMTFEEMIR